MVLRYNICYVQFTPTHLLIICAWEVYVREVELISGGLLSNMTMNAASAAAAADDDDDDEDQEAATIMNKNNSNKIRKRWGRGKRGQIPFMWVTFSVTNGHSGPTAT